ncbi:MAG TPA: efflux RND transporter periplasmic adaptor subunit [Ensifer sp.]|nr:efflux RND transporter periplasmic adaptor subunit [Ensifer sp.]
MNSESNTKPAVASGAGRLVARLIVTVALVAGGWAAWHYLGAQPERRDGRGRFFRVGPQTVREAVAAKGDIPIYVDALGTVTPLATVTIKTQVSGTLQSVAFTEGQALKAGDPIANIDPRPYQATLQQQQAGLAKDRAALDQAENDLKRYQSLAKQDSISSQQVSDQTYLVEQDKAAVASDEAQIGATNLNLAYTRIVSPISGLAGLRQVDPGNYVTPGDANGIVVITQMQPMGVVFSVPEDSVSPIVTALKTSGSLPVALNDRANVHEIARGRLDTVNNQIDTTTGTLKMRASFDNADQTLYPNQFVNVRLLVNTVKDAIVIPAQAVQLGASGNYVYVIGSDNKVKVTPVTLGPAAGDSVSIASGVALGDHVVIDGVDQLRDGSEVQLAGAAPIPASGGNADQHQHSGQHKHGDWAGHKDGSAGDAPDEDGQPRHHKKHAGDAPDRGPAAQPSTSGN